MKDILFQFGLPQDYWHHQQPIGNGLINFTWLISGKEGDPEYILQKINQQVFKHPEDIGHNINLLGTYLQVNFPDYLFVSHRKSIRGTDWVTRGDAYYRVFPFIENSHTVDVVEKPQQAFEAAKQFGRFTKQLAGLDASQLKITLPGFHNLPLRYQQFETILQTGNARRIGQSKELISVIRQNKRIVDEYEKCKTLFQTRVTHHDTKISNVLFDAEGNGLCVIDLDTVMPGYFISDLGDMLRTYVCPVSEEEKDFSKIVIRRGFFDAVIAGYLSEMGEELNEVERQHLTFAGEFMIYMQAIRFLTDHLDNDTYYGAKYEGHNFVRAANQLTLLQRLQEFITG